MATGKTNTALGLAKAGKNEVKYGYYTKNV